jgi:hypothetical protein
MLSEYFGRDVIWLARHPKTLLSTSITQMLKCLDPGRRRDKVEEQKLGPHILPRRALIPRALGAFFDLFPLSVLTTFKLLERLNEVKPTSRFETDDFA